MESINLTVSGMTCGACIKHVEKAIHSVAGVKSVDVDLASGTVNIEGDIAQKISEIILVLEEDGYPAQVSLGEVAKTKNSSCKSGSSCCCG